MDFLLLLYVYHLASLSDKNFHLIFCNVGQGDGILMRSQGGFDIVVDGGPHESSMTKCLERHLPFWDRTIDAVFMTHPDSDHLTGLIGVVRSYNVRYFGTSKAPKGSEVYKELMLILEKKKIPVTWVFRGDKVLTNDGVVITAHWPTQDFINSPSEETNDYSLVQLVSYGKFKALLTGDVPSVYLNSIIPTVGSVDIFKPPHHGSKTGVDQYTFQHMVPKYAVLSYGKKNRYGHPNKEVIQALSSNNIPYTDTSNQDVEIISDGKKWWVRREN